MRLFKLLSELGIKEIARIVALSPLCPLLLKRKFLSLGFVRGSAIFIVRTAPMGCPLEIDLSGNRFSLRKEEAAFIAVQSLDTEHS